VPVDEAAEVVAGSANFSSGVYSIAHYLSVPLLPRSNKATGEIAFIL